MSGFASWVTGDTVRLIGLTLLHFLWQGIAIAAAALAGMTVMRRASTKYLMAVVMMALMVAAPAVTFSVLAARPATALARDPLAGLSKTGQPQIATLLATTQILNFGAAPTEKASSIYLLWLVEAWFGGVLLLSLRPAAGFFLIERMRIKKGAPVTRVLHARCLELQRRMGLSRVVQYRESLQLQAPAVVGWFRPVVLLPISALTGLSAQQLELVIAHELAHVKRLDPFVNLFQIAAETLLFYPPAVWWLSKKIRAERENCCDDVAIAVCGNAVEYARALAAMAEWQSVPALAMAANRSPLAERVARLLGVSKLHWGARSAGIAGSMLCLCASVLAGNALLGAAQAKKVTADQSPAPAMQQGAPEDHGAAILGRPQKRKSKPVPSPAAESSAMPQADTITSANQDEQEQQTESNDSRGEEGKASRSGSYIDGLKAEGITDVSIDQLIAMKIQNVPPKYVHRIHALGLKPAVNELIAM